MCDQEEIQRSSLVRNRISHFEDLSRPATKRPDSYIRRLSTFCKNGLRINDTRETSEDFPFKRPTNEFNVNNRVSFSRNENGDNFENSTYPLYENVEIMKKLLANKRKRNDSTGSESSYSSQPRTSTSSEITLEDINRSERSANSSTYVALGNSGVHSNMPKIRDKKTGLIEEIIKTEENYIKKLSFLIENFKKPIEIKSKGTKDLESRICDVFGNIEMILFWSSIFLRDLELSSYNYEAVGQTFLEYRHLFELYVHYIKIQMQSEYLCDTLFRSVINEIENVSNDSIGMRDLLLEPVFRLTRYSLLLRKLNKRLMEDNIVVPTIKDAIDMLEYISKLANDMVALKSILSLPHSQEEMGHHVLDDVFMLQSPRMKIHVFFFEMMIILTSPKDSRGYYPYMFTIPTSVLQMNPLPNRADTLRFQLINYKAHKANARRAVFLLEARSLKIKEDWTEKIRENLWNQLSDLRLENKKKYSS